MKSHQYLQINELDRQGISPKLVKALKKQKSKAVRTNNKKMAKTAMAGMDFSKLSIYLTTGIA